MTSLVPCSDAHFAWMLGETPSPDLRLPPGGVEAAPVLEMLRALVAKIRDTHPACAWLMTQGEEVVGLCSFTRAADEEGIPYIGYGVAESRRGRGHATRAIRLMAIEVLRDPNVRGIGAETAIANIPSQRVLEESGFAKTGTRLGQGRRSLRLALPQMIVRRATAADAEDAARVFTAAFASMHFVPKIHSAEEDRAFVRQLIADKEVWVAERIGHILGLACWYDGWLEQLYVDPAHHNSGTGTALLARVMKEHPEGFQLWTFQANAGARRFYERHSFVAVEFTDGTHNEENTPDVRYVWPLRNGTSAAK